MHSKAHVATHSNAHFAMHVMALSVSLCCRACRLVCDCLQAVQPPPCSSLACGLLLLDLASLCHHPCLYKHIAAGIRGLPRMSLVALWMSRHPSCRVLSALTRSSRTMHIHTVVVARTLLCAHARSVAQQKRPSGVRTARTRFPFCSKCCASAVLLALFEVVIL